MSGHKGNAALGTTTAQVRRALLSLEHSTSAGRAVCIAWVERHVTEARSRSEIRVGPKPGSGGAPRKAVYEATLTLKGQGTMTRDIGMKRERASEGVPPEQRKPTELWLNLPFQVNGKSTRFYLAAKTLVVQNNDGTFALKEGVYKFKSRFDDGEMVDVRVEKRDVTAVAAMEVEV